MPRIALRTLALSLVLAATCVSLAQAAPHVRFFLSPSGNISCELDVGRAGIADAAFCQSVAPARSATLAPSGHLKVCRGQGCLGNPPEHDATLAYGRSVSLGPFRCSSRPSGISCTTAKGGFAISRSGVVSTG